MRRLEIFVLVAIIILAFGLRLYKINRPIADWHSWRQADTAAVARNFTKDGFNLLVPKYDDMSSQANGLDNPQRYRFVEFPIYNSLVAIVWKIIGSTQAVYARLTTVVITLFSTLFLYLLVKKFSNWQTASLAAFFFAIIPYNVFYSSTVLPAPFMVFSLLGLYYFFAKWMENDKKKLFGILSVVFANLAILSWPIALLFMLPPFYLAYEKYQLSLFKKPHLWVFAILSLTPFILWRIWMLKFPQGIPNFQFLLNENNIRFKGAFFRWLIAERMGKLILTTCGFALLILGLVQKEGREKWFYFSYLASTLLYLSVFASGNVRHDYYQIPAVPILCVFMAIGAKMLLFPTKDFVNKYISRTILAGLVFLTVALGYYEVQGFYWINKPEIVEAGKAADRLLPKEATVVAPYLGDTALLYQTGRRGYPITDRDLRDYIKAGTKFLVSVDVNDAGIQNLAQDCKTIEKTDKYVIVEMFEDCIGK